MLSRDQFPILKRKINNKSMIYFDNAATTQKPQNVIQSLVDFYEKNNSNVHRSINPLGEEATRQYEAAREKLAKFINAKHPQEIIFTSGTTESINLVAQSWGRNFLKKDDIIILSLAEHHSNLVPWIQLKKEIGVKLEFINLASDFRLDLAEAEKLLNKPKVKLLAIQHASNVLGIVNPLEKIFKIAKAKNIITLADAAQSLGHLPIDAQKLNCDFLAVSGHKALAPTGIGALYAKKELLEKMPAWQGGGEMIREVFRDRFTENDLPYKFEAGTPNIGGAIAFGAALDFLSELGFKKIQKQEEALSKYFLSRIKQLDFIKLIGPKESKNRLPIFSLIISGAHPHDAADLLGEAGIITRAGHHCAQVLHDELKISATLRASLSFYNSEKEIDKFILEIKKIYQKFK